MKRSRDCALPTKAIFIRHCTRTSRQHTTHSVSLPKATHNDSLIVWGICLGSEQAARRAWNKSQARERVCGIVYLFVKNKCTCTQNTHKHTRTQISLKRFVNMCTCAGAAFASRVRFQHCAYAHMQMRAFWGARQSGTNADTELLN